MNGSFETYAAELQRLRDKTNLATVEIGELNTEAQANRDVIAQAANISDQAIAIAQQAARAEIQETREQFLDLMALSLRALGLREAISSQPPTVLRLHRTAAAPSAGPALSGSSRSAKRPTAPSSRLAVRWSVERSRAGLACCSGALPAAYPQPRAGFGAQGAARLGRRRHPC